MSLTRPGNPGGIRERFRNARTLNVTFSSLAPLLLKILEQGLLSLKVTLARLGVCLHRRAEFSPYLTKGEGCINQ